MSDHGVVIRWAQVNNAIVPVIYRTCNQLSTDVALLPLQVVRYAVGLLQHVRLDTVYCTDDEARALTKCCQDVGIEICFDKNTELIQFDNLLEFSEEKVVFFMLPSANRNGGDKSLSRDEHVIKRGIPLIKEDRSDCVLFETLSGNEDELKDGHHDIDTQNKMLPKSNKEIPVVMTTDIFGEQVHCLLKDKEYYVLIEELQRLFFCHIRLSLFLYIVKQLVTSTIDLPDEESRLLTAVIGRVKYNKVVRFTEVRHLLVKMKAILKKSKRRNEDLSNQRDNICQSEPLKTTQSALLPVNMINAVLPNCSSVPLANGIVLNVVQSDNDLSLESGRHHNFAVLLNPITQYRVVEKVNFTQPISNHSAKQNIDIDASSKVIGDESERTVSCCQVSASVTTECKQEQHKDLSKLTLSASVTRDQSLSHKEKTDNDKTVCGLAVTLPTVTDPAVPRSTVTDPAVPRPTVTDPAVPRSTVTDPAVPRSTVAGPAVPHPTVTDPAVPRPTVTDPAVHRPTVTDPAVPRPTVTDPAVPHPTITGPAVPRPTVTGPAVPHPTVTDPIISSLAVTDLAVPHATVTGPIISSLTVTDPAVPHPTVTDLAVPRPTVTDLAVPRPTVTDSAVPHPTVTDPAVPRPTVSVKQILKTERKKRRLLDIVDKVMKKKRIV